MERLENESHQKNLDGSFRRSSPSVFSGDLASTLPMPIKVRCPDCLKLYAVDPSEIKVSRPRFECVACHARFWLAYPESVHQGEIIGFPLEWIEKKSSGIVETPDNATRQEAPKMAQKEPAIQQWTCPKCQSPYAAGSSECRSCGLIFAKFEALQSEDLSVYASPELKAAWEEVILGYENENLHQRFLQLCQQDDNLQYAANKYRRLLEASPTDELANKMRDAVMALTTIPITTAKGEVKRRSRIPFFAIMIFLSSAVMVIGYLAPQLRNLVGFGAAVMFFSLAIRFYFGRQ